MQRWVSHSTASGSTSNGDFQRWRKNLGNMHKTVVSIRFKCFTQSTPHPFFPISRHFEGFFFRNRLLEKRNQMCYSRIWWTFSKKDIERLIKKEFKIESYMSISRCNIIIIMENNKKMWIVLNFDDMRPIIFFYLVKSDFVRRNCSARQLVNPY